MTDNKYFVKKKHAGRAIIIQARMNSDRFPNKVMQPLAGAPLVEYVYRRCSLSSDKVVLVATSDDPSDDILYKYCIKHNIPVMRGDLHNVLKRYIQASELVNAWYIIRVCADTPFIDILLIDELLKILINEHLDYVSFNRDTCAAAFYSEAVTQGALKRAASLTDVKEDIEHVTKFIIDNPDIFLTKFLNAGLNPESIKKLRLTIDYPEDILRANTIVSKLKNKMSFASQEIISIASKIEW